VVSFAKEPYKRDFIPIFLTGLLIIATQDGDLSRTYTRSSGTRVKETYISSKEPYIPSKEPYIL